MYVRILFENLALFETHSGSSVTFRANMSGYSMYVCMYFGRGSARPHVMPSAYF